MFKIEIERETDGRWLAEIPALPGVMAYGGSAAEASERAKALALQVLAERMAAGEEVPKSASAVIDRLFAAA